MSTANGSHFEREFGKLFGKVRVTQLLEGEVAMKRIFVLALLVVLNGSTIPSVARGASPADDTRQSAADKEELKKQRALAKYQKAHEKAQAKAQRNEDKRQRKAAEKYEKEQRKLLKASSRPQKEAS
jgi:hypothetical protein